MVDPLFLYEVLDRLTAELEAQGTRYAIAGGVALVAWVEPRATTDIDVLVAVSTDDAPAYGERLGRTLGGFSSMRVLRFKSGTAIQRVVVTHPMGELLIDLMLPTDAIFDAAIDRRVRGELPITGRTAWFATAEDLVVMKLRAWRDKDRLDIRQLMALEGFDVDYVERQATALGLVERWHAALALAAE